MIIGVKYWNRSGSAPGTWTDLQVAECESDYDRTNYDEGEALDGELFAFNRRRYFVRIVVDPLSFNDATYGAVVTALRNADFCRINDDRYSWLGSANTVDFIVPSNRANRSEQSLLTRMVEMEMRGESVL